jgi:hypothetical protein
MVLLLLLLLLPLLLLLLLLLLKLLNLVGEFVFVNDLNVMVLWVLLLLLLLLPLLLLLLLLLLTLLDLLGERVTEMAVVVVVVVVVLNRFCASRRLRYRSCIFSRRDCNCRRLLACARLAASNRRRLRSADAAAA